MTRTHTYSVIVPTVAAAASAVAAVAWATWLTHRHCAPVAEVYELAKATLAMH